MVPDLKKKKKENKLSTDQWKQQNHNKRKWGKDGCYWN